MNALEQVVGRHGLCITGWTDVDADDGLSAGIAVLALIGPDPVRFWPSFSASAEYGDGLGDPLDRWSRRILDGVATEVGAVAIYPFGGPPWQPFPGWAARGEAARASPVGMQVSPARGLWMSYRGALGLADMPVASEASAIDPCAPCPRPCLNACPVDAFAGGRYDVAACVSHISTPEGASCHDGCLVRRACPVGPTPPEAQRRFHMEAFLKAHGHD